jgi:uncharacterized protein YgiM (DUF1202 family)
MKIIKITIALAITSFAFNSHAQYDDQRVVSSYYEFEEGSTEHLYGDDVILRKKAANDSYPIDTLSIGDEVTILKRTKEVMLCYGLESNWYKVQVGGKTGYILGGFIALDQVKIEDVTYLVIVAGVEENEYEYKVRSRVLKANGDYYGHESSLNTNSFYLEVFDDRGVKGIDNMLRINLFAEACGMDGGEIYLFNKGDKLVEAIQLSSVSDGGVFWFRETITFPDDENNYGDAVYYERELGHYLDDEMQITRSVSHELELQWEDGKFSPNIREIEFAEE